MTTTHTLSLDELYREAVKRKEQKLQYQNKKELLEFEEAIKVVKHQIKLQRDKISRVMQRRKKVDPCIHCFIAH